MKRIIAGLAAATCIAAPLAAAPTAAQATPYGDEIVYRADSFQLSRTGSTAYVTFTHGYCEGYFQPHVTTANGKTTVTVTGRSTVPPDHSCIYIAVMTTIKVDIAGVYPRTVLFDKDGKLIPFQGFRTRA